MLHTPHSNLHSHLFDRESTNHQFLKVLFGVSAWLAGAGAHCADIKLKVSGHVAIGFKEKIDGEKLKKMGEMSI